MNSLIKLQAKHNFFLIYYSFWPVCTKNSNKCWIEGSKRIEINYVFVEKLQNGILLNWMMLIDGWIALDGLLFNYNSFFNFPTTTQNHEPLLSFTILTWFTSSPFYIFHFHYSLVGVDVCIARCSMFVVVLLKHLGLDPNGTGGETRCICAETEEISQSNGSPKS